MSMKTTSKNRRSPRRLVASRFLEALESRTLFSGNVLASVSNGVLDLTGNNLANSIVVDQASLTTTQLRVSSGDGSTTINGKTAALIFSGVTGISVTLGCGNDTLVVQNATVTNNVQISASTATRPSPSTTT